MSHWRTKCCVRSPRRRWRRDFAGAIARRCARGSARQPSRKEPSRRSSRAVEQTQRWMLPNHLSAVKMCLVCRTHGRRRALQPENDLFFLDVRPEGQESMCSTSQPEAEQRLLIDMLLEQKCLMGTSLARTVQVAHIPSAARFLI